MIRKRGLNSGVSEEVLEVSLWENSNEYLV
jgi:hypothetical protein